MRCFSLICLVWQVLSTVAELTLLRTFGDTTVLRDPDYGTPVILNGDVESAFQGLGYAHATDRLWQLFLRYAATTGRLAEFFGAGADNINLDSDLDVVSTMYTDEEIMDEFESSFTDVAKAAYKGFALGLAARVEEVNNHTDKLLPYEFRAEGFPSVPTIFTLQSCLHYSLATMRGLCQGHYPTSQLDQLDLLSKLQQRLGNLSAAQQAFDDLITREGLTKLTTTIIPDVTPFVPLPSRVTPHIPESYATFARSVLETNRRVVAHRLKRGMMTLDGSWAMVVGPSRTSTQHTMLQAGPQDPMTFPTTFYEAYLDAPPFQAHYFTEPGCPLNQIYGVFGNWTGGRNRGYLPANDFKFEGVDLISPHHNVTILVLGQAPVNHTVFRSASGGFVISQTPEGMALTLRSVFLGQELRGLSFLIDLMLVKDVTGLQALLASSLKTNSDVTHSFVAWGDNRGNIAGFLNGVWTQLPREIDRRLPQNISGANLPLPYTFQDVARPPVLDVNHPQGFYAGWNTPFNSSFPWFDTRYGGLWRSQWIQDYLVSNSPLSFDKFKQVVQHQQLASSLGLGGNTEFDPFPRLFYAPFSEIVGRLPTPERLHALQILKNYTGEFLSDLNSSNIQEDYMLANAWLFRICQAVFGNLTFNTSSALPPLDPNISLAVPALELQTTHRFPQLLHSILSDEAHFNWLSGVNLDALVVGALDDSLAALGNRPWGKHLRLTLAMDGVGGVLGTVGSVPAGQCQSLNLAIEMSPCGPVQVESAVPFGVSGTVLGDKDTFQFDPHARDQFELYALYSYRTAFSRRFQSTVLCEQPPSSPDNLLWLLPVGAVVGLVLIAILLRRLSKKEASVTLEYVPVTDAPATS